MDLLLCITIGFIIIEFGILVSAKKSLEIKLAIITENIEGEESSRETKSIVWWIGSTIAWGIVSIILIVWWFYNHFG